MIWGLSAALFAGVVHSTWVLVGACLLLFIFVCRSRPSRWQASIMVALLAALFVYGWVAIEAHDRRVTTWDKFVYESADEFSLTGWVSSFPYESYGSRSFKFTTSVSGIKMRVRARATDFRIGYGDSLSMRCRVRKGRASDPGDRSRQEYLKGLGVVGDVRALPGSVRVINQSAGSRVTRRWLWPMHERVRQTLRRGLGARSGYALALVLGERGELGRGAKKAFNTLGITHLLALSGLHLGMVTGALLLLARLTRVSSRMPLALVLTAYVGLVGYIPSLYRAFAMAVTLISAAAAHRPLRPLTALGNAALVLLLANPNVGYSLGFRLSFLATLAVLLCIARLHTPAKGGWLARLWSYARTSVAVSMAAQLVVAPLVLHVFGHISLMSPIATLLFLPPVAVLLLGSAGVCIAAVIYPGLGLPLFDILGAIVGCFDACLTFLVRMTPEPLQLRPPNVWLYYFGVAVLALRARGRIPVAIGAVLLLAAVGIAYL